MYKSKLVGPRVDETHYYPFGLIMSVISSRAIGGVIKKKGYNGNELQNKEFSDNSGLEFYDFNARTFDQQIGRFVQIDPMTDEGGQDSWSPYHFGYNNPVRYGDPDGEFPIPLLIPIAIKAVEAAIVTYAAYKTAEAAKPLVDNIVKSIEEENESIQKENIDETGSYTNTHESKSKYHGKGPLSRAEQSAKEKEKKYNDPIKEIEWKPAPNNEEAFKDEAKRIRQDGGVQNPNNYNKRNSPGEKELKREEAQKAVKGKSSSSPGAGLVTPIIVPLVKLLTWLSTGD